MTQTIHVTKQPVILEGFQAVLKPSKYGHSLCAILDEEMIEILEAERSELLKWCESRLKNPSRSVMKPEPWEEISKGKYKIKFTWNEKTRPTVVDSEGTLITDENIPIYGGTKVKIAFRQKPYVMPDQITYGTSCKLSGVQVVVLSTPAGVDSGDLDESEVAALFGTTKGFKVSEPNITVPEAAEPDNDF